MESMQTGIMGIASKVVMIIGIFTMISFSAKCIIAGLFMIIISVIIIFVEAPVCCSMFPTLKRFESITNYMNHITRGILYFVAGVIPLCLCFGIGLLFGCLALFACSAFHIWQFIKERKSGHSSAPVRSAEEGQGGVVIGGAPPPYSQVSAGDVYNDPYAQKAAIGFAKHAVASGGNQPPASGGYPGF